jgi:rubrerythrin
MHGIAKLFRAVAEAETIHAIKHFRTAGGVKTTKENIQAAISGETEEFTHMYPRMIADAKEEGNKSAEVGFDYANKVEALHAKLFKKALEDPDKFPVQDYWICKICGHTAEAHVPDTCPVCGANTKAFYKV